MIGQIFLLSRRFINNNTKKLLIKSQNRSIKNPLQLRVVHDPCFLDKHRNNKQPQRLRFCLYIVRGWRYTSINLILDLEEPVVKSLSISHVIIQGSETITNDGMNNLGSSCLTNYEIMHGGVSLGHCIKFILPLEIQLKILVKFIKLGIFK